MILTKKIIEIQKYLEESKNIEYRIINNTLGKNLILLSGENTKTIAQKLISDYSQYIQEIIIEDEEEDTFIIEEIKRLCPKKDSIIHRNVSYVNWNRKVDTRFDNIIAGYSFKGGMGRSTTLAYLAYLYTLLGKKVAVLDCDFEAPGIASMFFEKKDREKKSGILDYFVDLNIEEAPKLSNYYLENNFLYLFPSGIDYNIENYMNKISKTDFNSIEYTKKFTALLTQINTDIKPDLIFIDLRAGINESNGLILKQLSNTNLMFFNSEEQNEDGLQVVLSLFKNLDNNFIMNSTIRYQLSAERERNENKLKTFLENNFRELKQKNIIPIPYESVMLESSIEKFKSFINSQKDLYDVNKKTYLNRIIRIINEKYFNEQYEDELEETKGMKRRYGTQGQISFNSDTEYYQALGYLAKSDGTTSLTWENNEQQGAWGSEGRIHFYIDNPKITGYFRHTKGRGNVVSRVNCNEFLLNLHKNHNFVSGNKQDIDAIRATIPDEYIDDFNYGLSK